MQIVFMGTPDFAVACLEHLVIDHHQVLAVYTRPDKPAGRGRPLVSSPVKRAALSLGLPVEQPPSLKGAEVAAKLAGFAPDVIVVTAFGQILPQSVLDIPRYGCINVHFSLLPRFRGASPVTAAILSGDNFTGVTVMLMDKGLDTGPVLASTAIPVFSQDTTGSLTFKLSQVGARLLPEVLVRLPGGEIIPRTQNEAEATFSATIPKEAGEIDWQQPAADIWRRVRAFEPWPGCYTTWQGKHLRVIGAVPLPEGGDGQVGQVMSLAPDRDGVRVAFGVQTGAGVLGVLTVQLEGKRAMAADEFIRGQRGFIGSILPSG